MVLLCGFKVINSDLGVSNYCEFIEKLEVVRS